MEWCSVKHIKYECNSLAFKEQGNSSILCFSQQIKTCLLCSASVVDLYVISIKKSSFLFTGFFFLVGRGCSCSWGRFNGTSSLLLMPELISSGICTYWLSLFTVIVLTFMSAYNVFWDSLMIWLCHFLSTNSKAIYSNTSALLWTLYRSW